MDKETIRKEADKSCCKNFIFDPDNEACYRQGFRDGAEWRIDEVWHDCQKELPEKEGEWILLEAVIDGKTLYLQVMWMNDRKCVPDEMKRWAYVADLIPDGKEAQP